MGRAPAKAGARRRSRRGYVRRRCLEVCGAPLKAGAACMEAATLARKAGEIDRRARRLRDAARLGIDSEACLGRSEGRAPPVNEALVVLVDMSNGPTRSRPPNKAYASLEPIEANCHVIARRFGIQRVLDDCHGSMNILMS